MWSFCAMMDSPPSWFMSKTFKTFRALLAASLFQPLKATSMYFHCDNHLPIAFIVGEITKTVIM
jgi:hypothetical protein